MKRSRFLGAAAVTVVGMIALSGCAAGGAATASATGEPADTLRVALAEVTSTLDPAKYNVPANFITMAGTAGYLISNPFEEFPDQDLYSGDVPILDPDTYDPELATDWSLSEDGLQLTMNLRDGVTSPYGNELTADDLVWTVQRNIALNSVGVFGMTVAKIDKTNPITVVDDDTVVWNLTSPSPLLEKVLGWSWFAPFDSTEAKSHATTEDPWATAWLTEHSAFYGPYNVTEFTPGTSATLSVNPNYWDEAPAITTIVMQSVPDAGNRQQLVQRGDVDFVADIPRSQLASLRDDPAVEVTLGPALRFSYLQYNTTVAPLSDPRVRQAISFAIPYDQILSDAYQDTALPAETVGTWLPGAELDEPQFTYDPDHAAELLQEAGVTDLSLNLLYSMSNPGPENEQVAVLIKDSLAKIGVTVNLTKPSSDADFTAAYSGGDFDLAIAGLAPGAPDLGYALYAMAATGASQNYGTFSDPAFDAAALDAISNTDGDARAASAQEALSIYGELVPATPIANPLAGIVSAPGLADVRLGVWANPIWKYLTLTK